MIFKRIENTEADLKELQSFLDDAGNSLQTFRYFSRRELSVIKDHVATILMLEDDKPIGYGHLDPEGDNVWLGICIQEHVSNNGHGYSMMEYLIDFARNNNIEEIFLKVDENNLKAIRMYKKFAFEAIAHEPKVYYIMKRVCRI